MPVSGFQYNTRPYSSFRTTRGTCSVQHTTSCATNYQPQLTTNNCSKTSLNTNSSSSSNNNSSSCSSHLHHQTAGHSLQTSASSSSIGVRTNNNNNGNNNCSGASTNFQRQQPFRSSYYGTRYNFKTAESHTQLASKLNVSGAGSSINGSTASLIVKPLTPKLVKRIETTCTHHTKPKAPAPPVANGVCSTPPTAPKQYLRTRNQQQPPTPPLRKSSNFDRFHQANLSIRQKTNSNASPLLNSSRTSFISSSNNSQEKFQQQQRSNATGATQKRAYTTTVSKVTKENQPKAADNNGSHSNSGPIKSTKSYPAPLPPQGTPKALPRRKCKEESRLNSVSASPNLNNRRFISSVGINSFNASCNPKATPLYKRKTYVPTNSSNNTNTNGANNTQVHMSAKTGSNCSNSSSAQSSASQGSPKSKKAFSTKFPQGLPFEDEFYRRHRSYSQSSSSNYSFYSSNGTHNTAPHTPHDYDREEEEDDEFQRKPSTDDALYVDFSKVMHRNDYKSSNTSTTTTTNTHHYQTTSTTHTTWLRRDSPADHKTSNYDTSHDSPHSPRRNYHHNHHQYLPPTPPTARAAETNASIRSRTKYSQSINDYLYTSNGAKLCTISSPQNTSDSRKSLLYSNSKLSSYLDPLQNADNGYYTHASPESSPPSITTTTTVSSSKQIMDTSYMAVSSSWAPKCSHPTKVLIPAAAITSASNATNCDSNNNKDYYNHQHRNSQYCPKEDYYEKFKRYNSGCGSKVSSVADKSEDVLELTNSEYSFDSSSRRRKERSKRSHRKSPTSGRRVHKYRYRDDASHSSSRRRHRDRAKDERDSGRNNRRSHSKGIIAAQHRAIQYGSTNIPIIPIRVQKISQTKVPLPQLTHAIVIEPPNLSIVKEGEEEDVEQEEDKEYSLSPWHRCPTRRQRNLFDLVLECEFKFERFLGDWIQDEYFVELDNAYLVSFNMN